MRPKSLLLLMLALGCGLVASIGINQVLASRKAGDAAVDEIVKVYVVKEEVGPKDKLTEESVFVKEFPKSTVPPDAIFGDVDTKELFDRRSRTRLFANDILTEAKLLAPGESSDSAAGSIPVNMRTVPMDVSSAEIGRLLQIGDFVDVVLTLAKDQAPGIAESTTLTLLQNVKVFAIDERFTLEDDESAAPEAKTVQLLVTPEEASRFVAADTIGKLRLVMRSANDTKMLDQPPIRVSQLLEEMGIKPPAALTPPVTPAPSNSLTIVNAGDPADLEPTDEWTTIVYEAAQAREVRFRNGKPIDPASTGPAHQSTGGGYQGPTAKPAKKAADTNPKEEEEAGERSAEETDPAADDPVTTS